MQMRDTMIAATAAVRGWAVATRNTTDFAPLGVTVFDPWTQPVDCPVMAALTLWGNCVAQTLVPLTGSVRTSGFLSVRCPGIWA